MKSLVLMFLMVAGVGSAQTTVGAGINSQAPVTFAITLVPPAVVQSVTCPNSTMETGVGATQICTVTLNEPAPTDKTVKPTTSDATKVTVGAPFVIKAGSTTGTFVITAL